MADTLNTIDAMPMLDSAISVVLDHYHKAGSFESALQGVYPTARRDASMPFLDVEDERDAASAYESAHLDTLREELGEETVEAFEKYLAYPGADKRGSVWLDGAFIKPAIIGLAVWLDRMGRGDNATPMSAVMIQTNPDRSAYGIKLVSLSYLSQIEDRRRWFNLRAKTQSSLTCAAHWAMTSPTAQRFGYFAAHAEGFRHLYSTQKGVTDQVIRELGESPYIRIEVKS